MARPENPRDALIYALDADGMEDARKQVRLLKDEVGAFKIGFQLFLREGRAAVDMVHGLGGKVFLDLKFHDIPFTVAEAAREAVQMGVFMFNVHASGGRAMMEAAVKAAKEAQANPIILGVTVLTSMDSEGLARVGFREGPRETVKRLALLARESGLSGVVASPEEAAVIREVCGPDFTIVCPGIRPAGSAKGDQKRVATPAFAIGEGTDYLVVGRPIRDAKEPALAAREVVKEIEAAWKG